MEILDVIGLNKPTSARATKSSLLASLSAKTLRSSSAIALSISFVCAPALAQQVVEAGQTRDLTEGEIVEYTGDAHLNALTVRTGAVLTGTDAIIRTSGSYLTSQDTSNGIYAQANSSVNLTGGSVSATGPQYTRGILATGAGTTIITNGTDVSTAGTYSHAIHAHAGAVATITGGTISTQGSDSFGFYSQNAGSLITANNVDVITHGTNGFGVFAYGAGAKAEFNGGSITTSGEKGHGVVAGLGSEIAVNGASIQTSGASALGLIADQANTLITATDTDIVTNGTWSHGAHAKSSDIGSPARIELTGGSILTANETGRGSQNGAGSRSYGLFAEGAGASIKADGTIIETLGQRAYGVHALSGGQVEVDNVSISTEGFMAYGLYASGPGSVITANNVNVTTSGQVGDAAWAYQGGRLVLNGGTYQALGSVNPNTPGETVIGLVAVGGTDGVNNGVIDAHGVTVLTTGENAIGVRAGAPIGNVKTSGTISLVDSSVTSRGLNANAADIAHGSQLTATGSTLVSEQGIGVRLIDNATVVLNGTTVAAGKESFVSDLETAGATQSITVGAGSTVAANNGTLLLVNRSEDGADGIVAFALTTGSSAVGDILDTGIKVGGYTDVTLDGASLQGRLDGVQRLSLANATWHATGAGSIGVVAVGPGGGTIDVQADNVVLNGSLLGSGDLVKTGLGQLSLAGDGSAFAGTATIDAGKVLLTGSLVANVVINAAGTLQIGNGDASGNLTGATRNDGTLIFARSDDYDYTGALSGNGGLIKQGEGMLLLSGAYTYTGTTKVEAGLIKLASALDPETDLVVDGGTFDLSDKTQEVAGLSGSSGTLALGETGALTVNQSDNTTFAGNISGEGSFTKTGSGSLNLTGDSSFTGQVAIDGGRLAVNGTLPGDIVVNSGGTLGGTGLIGSASVGDGGVIAPGNSIGTLNVIGDVTFGAGSVYAVEVDAEGNSDLIAASGAAYINGGTVSVLAAAGNYRWATDYVILTAAGGVNGEFAPSDVNLPFLTATLNHNPNDVTLTLERNDRTFTSAAVTPNQRAVALALDSSAQTGSLYRAVASQTNEAGAAQAFDALSGELWATAGTFLVDQSRRSGELVLGRMQEADTISRALSNGGSAATQTRDGGFAVWGQGIGSWNKVKSDGNAARATQDQFGFITGLDAAVGNWRIGAAFSHTTGNIAVERGSYAKSSGSTVVAYVGGGLGPLRARAGASYGWHDIGGTRNVAFPNFSEQLGGSYDVKTASAFGELSFAATFGRSTVEPFAGINHVYLKSEGFTETGGSAVLGVGEVKRHVTFTTLGLRMGTDLTVSDTAVITPRVSAAWQHGFGDVAARMSNLLPTGQSFTIEGLRIARNALLLEAGAQASIMPSGSLSLAYVGNIADRWTDHGIKLGFSYRF